MVAHLLFLQHTDQRKKKSKELPSQRTKTAVKWTDTARQKKQRTPNSTLAKKRILWLYKVYNPEHVDYPFL